MLQFGFNDTDNIWSLLMHESADSVPVGLSVEAPGVPAKDGRIIHLLRDGSAGEHLGAEGAVVSRPRRARLIWEQLPHGLGVGRVKLVHENAVVDVLRGCGEMRLIVQ